VKLLASSFSPSRIYNDSAGATSANHRKKEPVMLHTLVVPLDGSSFGEHAVPYALSLARRNGAAVHLVHVYESLFDGVEGCGPLDEKALSDAERYLANVTQRLSAMGGVNITSKLLQGSVARAIHDYATQARADLIVMTTHGRSRAVRFWLGSIADKLIRRMPVPLLLVRPGDALPELHRDVFFQNILVPLDGSAFAEKVLEPLRPIAQVQQSNVIFLQAIPPTVLHAEEPLPMAATAIDPVLMQQLEMLQAQKRKQAEAYLQRMAAQWAASPGQARTCLVEHAQPATAVLEQAQALQVDLIALATHGRGGFSRMFLGSVADKIVRGSSLPVFVYHPPHE
jgi:nucleotide-binding universal stress UspA family protein